MSALLLSLLFLLFFLFPSSATSTPPPPRPNICIVGGGIAGASAAYFLQKQLNGSAEIRVFEKLTRVGGRMATVNLAGDVFEAGGSIIHPENLHAVRFASLLQLSMNDRDGSSVGVDDGWFGIWDGRRFVFETLPRGESFLPRKIIGFLNTVSLFKRYGLSILRMRRFVQAMLGKFLRYYSEGRPAFLSVDEMLKWSELYPLTQRTLEEELDDAGVSPLLISELITIITRINYGQSVKISGLAGAVSLAGSGDGLWSVDDGNWQLASGLLNHSKVLLNLDEEITSISNYESYYEFKSAKGDYKCEVAIIATPLDEVRISFSPPVSIPDRRLQHTYTTFVRGLLNSEYFGLSYESDIPDLVGTIEDLSLPFSHVSVLKRYNNKDKAYKIFSREPLDDDLLDKLFRVRLDTVKLDWAAYPHFVAPEVFAPFILDGSNLYYINAFENAASTIETSAVAAENVARLVLSKLSQQLPELCMSSPEVRHSKHPDL